MSRVQPSLSDCNKMLNTTSFKCRLKTMLFQQAFLQNVLGFIFPFSTHFPTRRRHKAASTYSLGIDLLHNDSSTINTTVYGGIPSLDLAMHTVVGRVATIDHCDSLSLEITVTYAAGVQQKNYFLHIFVSELS